MVKAPTWIRPDVVRAIHRRQLAEHGGQDGVRSEGLLESALNRPKNRLAYQPETTIAGLAACYGFGLSKNYPFVDGNKRVAYLAMRIFLKINGHDLVATRLERYAMMMRVASCELSEDELAAWVEMNSAQAKEGT